jgi:hypothetical protein
MSIAISIYSEAPAFAITNPDVAEPTLNVTVAAGFTDSGLGMGMGTRKALPTDEYVWGSITKMFTGPAILQLVERGGMVSSLFFLLPMFDSTVCGCGSH